MVLTAGVIPGARHYHLFSMEITDGERLKNSFRVITSRCQESSIIFLKLRLLSTSAGRIIAWNRAIEELTGELGADLLVKGQP